MNKTLARIGMVDAIVMLDVVEHLVDPIETLRLCDRILRPGDVVLVATGDFGAPVARLVGRRWRLMTPPQHLWFFSRMSVASSTSVLGWRMVSYKRPWKLVPVFLILFQIARMLGFDLKAVLPARFSRFGIPVNLFDAMQVVLRKPLAKARGRKVNGARASKQDIAQVASS